MSIYWRYKEGESQYAFTLYRGYKIERYKIKEEVAYRVGVMYMVSVEVAERYIDVAIQSKEENKVITFINRWSKNK